MAIPISDKSDEELMEEIARGKQASMRVLTMRYLSQSYTFIRRYITKIHEAEKVAQDVFVTIWQRASSWEATMRFKIWLYQLLIKKCEHYSSHYLSNIKTSAQAGMLKKQQKHAITLYYFQQYSVFQIAKILSLSPVAVKKLLLKGRKKLTQTLSKTFILPSENENGLY